MSHSDQPAPFSEPGTAPAGQSRLLPRSSRDCSAEPPILPSPPPSYCSTLRPVAADYQLDVTRHDYLTSDTRLKSQSYCMRSSIVGQNKERTHVINIPMPCKSWDCPRCGPRKRAAWIERLTAGKPEREITLTCPAGKFASPHLAAQAMKVAWRKLVARIRMQWGPLEYALVFELTKNGTPHMHILSRGGYIAQKWISAQWDALGIGPIVYIQSVKGAKLHSAHACKYLAKSNGQSAAILAPLRIIQTSSNYELEQPKKTLPEKYPDMVWTWDRRSVQEIAGEFEKDPRFISRTDNSDGSVELEMRPHPVPADLLDLPMFWAAWPGLAPIPHLYEPLPPGHFLRRLGSE
ncbi:hypothetical protein ES705_37005 [subsurface metagenome]